MTRQTITPRILIIAIPFFIRLSHYVAVFSYEYAQSIVAWLFAEKENPFALDYGGIGWKTCCLLVLSGAYCYLVGLVIYR